MIKGELELRLHQSPWNNDYEIAFFSKGDGKTWVGAPVKMKEHKSHCLVEPTARLSKGAMQGLFNEMWKLGFRPNDGTGNSGHVAAIQYHLEDMRKLVFAPGLGRKE